MSFQNISMAGFLLITALQANASEDPEITATVLNCLDDENVAAEVCALSNVERVKIKVVFDDEGHSGLPPFAEAVINPAPADSPDSSVIVEVIGVSTNLVVPVEAVAYETSLEDGKEVVKMTIEILEEESVRQNKVQAYVDDLRARQSAIPGSESQSIVDEMVANNADIVSALEELYTENRIGDFELMVKYCSDDMGSWTGEVTSSSILVEVLDKGSFFDSLSAP